MTKILVLNGPNLNLLGIREPHIYGTRTYQDLLQMLTEAATARGITVCFLQSNHEGALVDALQAAMKDGTTGIIFNPAAYTHTSVAIADAVKAIGIPTVEVHISDPDTREDFRRISYVRQACLATVKGEGFDGYIHALDILLRHLNC